MQTASFGRWGCCRLKFHGVGPLSLAFPEKDSNVGGLENIQKEAVGNLNARKPALPAHTSICHAASELLSRGQSLAVVRQCLLLGGSGRDAALCQAAVEPSAHERACMHSTCIHAPAHQVLLTWWSAQWCNGKVFPGLSPILPQPPHTSGYTSNCAVN